MDEVKNLSDPAAVKVLTRVVQEWSKRRGLEALVVVLQVRLQAGSSLDNSPEWAKGPPQASSEAGEFARKMLVALATGNDDEVASWTQTAVKAELASTAHVLDPLSLTIIGGIIIGSILAARVQTIGSVKFYKGIPKELANVLKTGASIAVPSPK
jgi:hypothetical protein